MATGRIRYWAAAKAAAGTAEEPYSAETLAAALQGAQERRPDDGRFAQVLASCALLVAGWPVGRRDPATVALAEGDVVEVLPPFAGG
jgi:sulfur-carrier protein